MLAPKCSASVFACRFADVVMVDLAGRRAVIASRGSFTLEGRISACPHGVLDWIVLRPVGLFVSGMVPMAVVEHQWVGLAFAAPHLADFAHVDGVVAVHV